MKLPGNKQKLLDNITSELKQVAGVKAIVLGGSYAMGMATENSDFDIGIYYAEQHPFDIEKIRNIAKKIAGESQPTVTGFYEWGLWVNGGAWINTANGEVDFLYKNIDQIIRIIDNAKKGIWENNYEQQPPYGFSSVTFLAETKYCYPLYDPSHIVRQLKASVELYPQPLKQPVVQQSLWSAEFAIWQAEKFAAKDDSFNTVGCLTRATKNIVNALFAINEIYPMGDKRAIAILEQATIRPDNLAATIDSILCCNNYKLADHVALLSALFEQTVVLADGGYKPYYVL